MHHRRHCSALLLGLTFSQAAAGCSKDGGHSSDDIDGSSTGESDGYGDGYADCGGDGDGDGDGDDGDGEGDGDYDGDLDPCLTNEFVSNGFCRSCPAGSTNQAGDDPTGGDTSCDPVFCTADQRVLDHVCAPCPPGTVNEAGDDASAGNSTCDAVLCLVDEWVSNNTCVPCGAAGSNLAGDDASSSDTSCDGLLCPSNQRVSSNACAPCPSGTKNQAGDDPAGNDTSCDPTFCVSDQRVESNVCVPCPPGTTNDAGDDASGPDTTCMDACEAAFGVSCGDFDEGFFKASNPEPNDLFGRSVAIDGDVMAIGAVGEDSNATGINGNQANNLLYDSGAVYVFRRTNGVWAQEAYLKASNTGPTDMFGSSVALSGDTLVVGAPRERSNATGIDGDETNDSAPDSGAVYVFRRINGVWAQEAYLKASNSDDGDAFGSAIDLSGDTIAVGADWEDSSATGIDGDQSNDDAISSGAVYVFRRANGVWAQEAYLKASNTEAFDWFGRSVALSGDALAVGAYGERSNGTGIDGNQADNSAFSAGAVYVFRRIDGVWSQEAYVKASNTGADDMFGWSVALSSDTLAVGAIHESSNATGSDGDQTNDLVYQSGAVYVFRHTNGVWAQEAYLKASNTGALDDFGHAVELFGDTLAISATGESSNASGINGDGEDDSATDSGAVYVFRHTTGVWAQRAYLKANYPGANNEFGGSLALSSSTLASGTTRESSNASGINGDESNNSMKWSGAVSARKIAP